MLATDKALLQTCYTHVREALDSVAQVRGKDRYISQVQGALYKMEDILYQYMTDGTEGKHEPH